MYSHIKKYTPYLFLLGTIVLLGVFFYVPFLYTLKLSFFDFSKNIYEPIFIGLENYKYLLFDSQFHKVIVNTFVYLLVCVPFLTLFPMFLAILINQKIMFLQVYKLIIYLPVIISIVVVAIAFKWLYGQNGIINYVLSLVNISPISFLTDPNVAIYSVCALTIFKGVGYYMMIYLASLMSVNRELVEACQVDGANWFEVHKNVTIPHLMPTIALVSTISSISALKVFVEIYMLTKGGPLNSTKTIVYYIYERAFENLDMGIASAASFILLIIVLAFSMINIFVFESKRYKI